MRTAYTVVSSNKPYKRAVLGGTFDRFHIGHELLLSTAAHVADSAFVGVVSDELGGSLFKSKKLASRIQSFDVRKQSVINYGTKNEYTFEVDALFDPWGPSITDPNADVIVVSRETRRSADKINKMRLESKLSSLDIITIPWKRDENGTIMSSTLKRESE